MDSDVAGVEGMFQGTYELVCPFTDYVMCVIGAPQSGQESKNIVVNIKFGVTHV